VEQEPEVLTDIPHRMEETKHLIILHDMNMKT